MVGIILRGRSSSFGSGQAGGAGPAYPSHASEVPAQLEGPPWPVTAEMHRFLAVVILFGQEFHGSKALHHQPVQQIIMSRQNRIDTASIRLVPWPARFLHLRGGDPLPNEISEDANETHQLREESTAIRLPNLSKEGFLERTPIKEILSAGHGAVGANVTVCGWARTVRIQGAGTFAFIELNDGSTFQSLQVRPPLDTLLFTMAPPIARPW